MQNTGNFTALLFRDRTVGFLVSAFRFRDGLQKATARDHYEVYTEQFNPEVYEELLIRGMMIGYGKLTREEQTAELDRFSADDQQLGNL